MRPFALLTAFVLLTGCASKPVLRAGPEKPAPEKTRETLTAKLPADTYFYARLDLRRAAESFMLNIRSISPDLEEMFAREAGNAVEEAKKSWPGPGKPPLILDRIQDAFVHLIVLKPPADRPGEELDIQPLLVLETEPEVAADFIQVLRREMKNKGLAEKADDDWVVLDVNLKATCLGSYLIVGYQSAKDFVELLKTDRQPNLTSTRAFQAYGRQAVPLFMAVNIPGTGFAGPATTPVTGGGTQRPEDFGVMLMDRLGIGVFTSLGGSLDFIPARKGIQYLLKLAAFHDAEISKPLKHLLEGGRTFKKLPGGIDMDLAFMLRLNLPGILHEIVTQLDPTVKQNYQMGSFMAKQSIGFTIDEILEALSGDLYFYMDASQQAWEALTNDDPTDESVDTLAGVDMLFAAGIKDRTASEKMLAQVYEKVRQLPGMQDRILNKTVRDRTAYFFGDPATGPSVGLVLLEDHILFGDRAIVENAVKNSLTAVAGQDEFGTAITEHPKANVMMVIARKVIEKIMEAEKAAESGSDLQMAKQALSALSGSPGSPKGTDRFVETLDRLLEILGLFQKMSSEVATGNVVIWGEHLADRYELVLQLNQWNKQPVVKASSTGSR